MVIQDGIIYALISGAFGAIVGGGLVAVINGSYLKSNTDYIWRSTHLIEDKKGLRNLLNELNESLFIFDLKKLAHEHIKYSKRLAQGIAYPNIQIMDKIVGYMNKMHLYLDENNPYVEKLYNSYFEFCNAIPKLTQHLHRNRDDDSLSLKE